MRIKRPVHESELPWETWEEGTCQEIHGKALCDVGGTAKVGVALVELPVNCDTRPAHYHTMEEEHLYGLSGSGTLHLGRETFELKPGCYVCFPPGQTAMHYLATSGTEPLRYLMIGERIEADRAIHG